MFRIKHNMLYKSVNSVISLEFRTVECSVCTLFRRRFRYSFIFNRHICPYKIFISISMACINLYRVVTQRFCVYPFRPVCNEKNLLSAVFSLLYFDVEIINSLNLTWKV